MRSSQPAHERAEILTGSMDARADVSAFLKERSKSTLVGSTTSYNPLELDIASVIASPTLALVVWSLSQIQTTASANSIPDSEHCSWGARAAMSFIVRAWLSKDAQKHRERRDSWSVPTNQLLARPIRRRLQHKHCLCCPAKTTEHAAATIVLLQPYEMTLVGSTTLLLVLSSFWQHGRFSHQANSFRELSVQGDFMRKRSRTSRPSVVILSRGTRQMPSSR